MKTAAGQNAGSKAPNDVVKIADNLNFKKLFYLTRTLFITKNKYWY